MSIITDIADSVTQAINSHDFSQEFTAARAYLPAFELKDLKDLRVTVVPSGVEMTTAGRGLGRQDVRVDVAVQKKLASMSNQEIDDLMDLVGEISDFLRATGRFACGTGHTAAWVACRNEPIYSTEHMDDQRLFTSVLTVTLRVIR